MQKFVAESTAQYPIGSGPGSKILKIEQGQFAGRMAALFQKSDSEIQLCWSDYPYRNWSAPQTVVNDVADLPFDAALLDDNSISIAYVDSAGNNLMSTKLLFVNGNWLPQNAVTVHNQDTNGYPCLAVEPDGKLWVAWCRDSGSGCYIEAKSSNDGGTTWSSIVELTTSSTSAIPKILSDSRHIYFFYALDGNRIAYRFKDFYSAIFEDEIEIVVSTDIEDNFDLTLSENEHIGLVYNDGQLRFVEFDGTGWRSATVVDSDGGEYPQIKYSQNVLYIVYLSSAGSSQKNIVYCSRSGSAFSSSIPIEPGQRFFDKICLYESGSGTFEDLTGESSDDSTGDIFHTESSALISQVGDALYLGMERKFNFIRFILAMAGSGGAVGWQYFDGNEWCGFTPEEGPWDFSETDKSMLLWQDLASMPSDWQKTVVQGEELYWIRVAVTTSFTVAPTGTQVRAIPNYTAIVLSE